MKKILCLIFTAVLFFGLTSCAKTQTAILDNSEKSYFVDFYTDENSVCIECVLNIYNPENKKTTVKITAIDNEDVETGLLKSPELVAKNKSDSSDTFELAHGENELKVIFTGEYAGVFRITNRAVPRFIVIENA